MKKIISLALLAATSMVGWADNPIVQTCFTTDPAPMVYNDTLYVYTGHDENGADFFWMQEWRVYSTTDMVNWTDHGSPAAIEDFTWGDDRAWAPQCVARNGKFYFYVPLHSNLSGGMAIGVAVGDSPTGPFHDALGKPLFDDGKWDNIDPTVLIDDDGQAYLFWGNPVMHGARLNQDMISFDGEPVVINQTIEGFGAPNPSERVKGVEYKDHYEEGPWLTKHGNKYYLLYAAGGIPEHIAYSTADHPFGEWTYQGYAMPLQDTESFTNHSGIINYKGNDYFFYHTGKLPGGGGFGRSVSVEQFDFLPDGRIPEIMATSEGVAPIATFNPYRRNQAETMAFSSGVETEPNQRTGVYVSNIHNGDWIKVANVDFGPTDQQVALEARLASARRGGTIEVRLDSIEGELISVLNAVGTGGWEEWETFEGSSENPASGVHDLYFLFKGRKGPKLFNFDWWELKKKK